MERRIRRGVIALVVLLLATSVSAQDVLASSDDLDMQVRSFDEAMDLLSGEPLAHLAASDWLMTGAETSSTFFLAIKPKQPSQDWDRAVGELDAKMAMGGDAIEDLEVWVGMSVSSMERAESLILLVAEMPSAERQVVFSMRATIDLANGSLSNASTLPGRLVLGDHGWDAGDVESLSWDDLGGLVDRAKKKLKAAGKKAYVAVEGAVKFVQCVPICIMATVEYDEGELECLLAAAAGCYAAGPGFLACFQGVAAACLALPIARSLISCIQLC